jgi:nucleotide-binding universal stress UspA family protein
MGDDVMFKKVLVPLDGTPQSNVALPFARMLARACESELVLVRVVDPAILSADERQERRVQVLRQLERVADELHTAGIQTDVRVSTGDPVTETVRVADVEHADAVVVATHSSLLERLVDTSTVRRLIARSRLPVFVMRPGGRRVTRIRTILAAVDGSPGGAQALDEAIALARLTDAAVVLVRVVPSPEHFGFDPLLARTLAARPQGGSEERALAAAEEYVNVVAERLRRHGIDATPRVMIGPVAERIVTAAEQVDADLIVMSTHGYLAPLRTVLGSTADKVVESAGRPVLLVRRTDRAGQKPKDLHVGESLAFPQT